MEVYVIAIIIFLSAFVVSVIFFTFCYKKGNNNKKQQQHGEQRPAGINARRRNRASLSGGIEGNYNGNGAALVAGAAVMSAALTSIAIDGYHVYSNGDGGGGGDGNGGGES